MFRICALRTSLLLVALACALHAAAQSPAPQKATPGQAAAPPNVQRDPKIEEWKPSTLPADALAFGAALEENAPPQLKQWCENYAQKKMPNQPISPKAIMAAVDQEFAKDSDEARDAVGFLLYYLGYLEEDSAQKMLAARIRRIDDEAYDITRRMIIIKENQESAMSSTSRNRALSPQQVLQVEEEMRSLEQQLRVMGEDRKVKMAQLEMLRKRVDGYLKVMGVIHPRMNGIAASVLRTMQ